MTMYSTVYNHFQAIRSTHGLEAPVTLGGKLLVDEQVCTEICDI